MDGMDSIERSAQEQFRKKTERRQRLAKLPYPQKVRAIVQMQRMVAPIVQNRNPRACIWEFDEETDVGEETN